MREKIDLFLPCEDIEVAQSALLELHDNKTVQHINLLVSADFAAHHQVPDGCTFVVIDRLESSNTVESIAENTDADYVMICTKTTPIRWGLYALERFLRTADDTGAVMVYSDFYSLIKEDNEAAKVGGKEEKDGAEAHEAKVDGAETHKLKAEQEANTGKLIKHPVIDYQSGSLRDDFDFGSLWFIKAQALRDFIAQQDRADYQYAGLYDLRLYLSRVGEIFHLNEFLYTEDELDNRKSGEKQFDYVNPRNREVQIEMEKACTAPQQGGSPHRYQLLSPAGFRRTGILLRGFCDHPGFQQREDHRGCREECAEPESQFQVQRHRGQQSFYRPHWRDS